MRKRGVWAREGEVGGGKESELPDLNKVNFPAIWSVFRTEGKSLQGCDRHDAEASFSFAAYAKRFFSVAEPTQRSQEDSWRVMKAFFPILISSLDKTGLNIWPELDKCVEPAHARLMSRQPISLESV